jgi:hypothetical protein
MGGGKRRNNHPATLLAKWKLEMEGRSFSLDAVD